MQIEKRTHPRLVQPKVKELHYRRLTSKHLAILNALFRFGSIDTTDIHELTAAGTDIVNTRIRLQRLFGTPNHYIDRPRTQEEFGDLFYRPLLFQITRKGIDTLVAHRLVSEEQANIRSSYAPKLSAEDLKHNVYLSRIKASLQIGVNRLPNMEMYLPYEHFPQKGLSSLKVPLSNERSYTPDDFIAFHYTDKNKYLHTVLEADRHTEGVPWNRKKNTTGHNNYEPKILSLEEIRDNGLHKEYWGASTFHVAHVTTNPTRMAALKDVVRRVEDPRYHKYHLFGLYPDIVGYWERPPASQSLLFDPLERLDGSTFTLASV